MGQALGLSYIVVFLSFLAFHCYLWIAQIYPVPSLSFWQAAGLTFLGTCMHLTTALFGFSVRKSLVPFHHDREAKSMQFAKLTLGVLVIVFLDGLKNVFMMEFGSFLIWGIFDCLLVSLVLIELLDSQSRLWSMLTLLLWLLLKVFIFRLGFISTGEVDTDVSALWKLKVLLFSKTFILGMLFSLNLFRILGKKLLLRHWAYCGGIASLWFFYQKPSVLSFAVSQNYFTAITIGDTFGMTTYPLLHWFPVILGSYLLRDLLFSIGKKGRAYLLAAAFALFLFLPIFSANLAKGADFEGFMREALRDHYNTLFIAQMAYIIVFLKFGDWIPTKRKLAELLAYGYIFNYFFWFFCGKSLTLTLDRCLPRDYLFLVLLAVTGIISLCVGKLAVFLFSKKVEIKLVRASD
jgi:hypothetical protein